MAVENGCQGEWEMKRCMEDEPNLPRYGMATSSVPPVYSDPVQFWISVSSGGSFLFVSSIIAQG